MPPVPVPLPDVFSLFNVDPHARSSAEVAIKERVRSWRMRRRIRVFLASLDTLIKKYSRAGDNVMELAFRVVQLWACARIERALVRHGERSRGPDKNELRNAIGAIEHATQKIKPPKDSAYRPLVVAVAVDQFEREFEGQRSYVDLLSALERDTQPLVSRLRDTSHINPEALELLELVQRSMMRLIRIAEASLISFEAPVGFADKIAMARLKVFVALSSAIHADRDRFETARGSIGPILWEIREAVMRQHDEAAQLARERAARHEPPIEFEPRPRRSSNASSSAASSAPSSEGTVVTTYSA